MAKDEAVQLVTLPANADLSAKQYFAVAINSNGRVALAGDGALITGILYNKPDAQDKEAAVAISGRVKTEFGATVAAGDEVAVDSAGKIVPSATGDHTIGVAIEGGASGEIGSVLIGGMAFPATE